MVDRKGVRAILFFKFFSREPEGPRYPQVRGSPARLVEILRTAKLFFARARRARGPRPLQPAHDATPYHAQACEARYCTIACMYNTPHTTQPARRAGGMGVRRPASAGDGRLRSAVALFRHTCGRDGRRPCTLRLSLWQSHPIPRLPFWQSHCHFGSQLALYIIDPPSAQTAILTIPLPQFDVARFVL